MNNKKLISSLIASFILFVFILIMIKIKGHLFAIDDAVNSLMVLMQNNAFAIIMKIIGVIFGYIGMAFFSVIVAVLLWIKVSKKESIFF